MLCMPCKKAGVHAKNYAKIGYTFFQIVWMAVALLLFFLSDKLKDVHWIAQMAGYSDSDLTPTDALAI